MTHYWNDEQVENIQPVVEDNKRKFTVKTYNSDNMQSTLTGVKRIVIDVEKTSGMTVINLLDPNYSELNKQIETLKERINKLENKKGLFNYIKHVFERIFKK